MRGIPQRDASREPADVAGSSLAAQLHEHLEHTTGQGYGSAASGALRLGAMHGRPDAQTAVGNPTPQQALEVKQRDMLEYAAKGMLPDLIRSSERYSGDLNHLRDSQGNTLLHLAAASSNVFAAVFCLIRLNGVLESRNSEGRTPLLIAAAHGRDKTVKMLMECGANIFAMDNNRQNVFELAQLHCSPETQRFLESKLERMITRTA